MISYTLCSFQWNNPGNSSFQSTSNASSSYQPKSSLPIKTEHKFNHKYDTISLDGTTNIDSHDLIEDGHPFSFPRSCSSLPEKLSKSYDHYLSVSRKALSFSQHMEENKTNNNDNDEDHQRERTIAEKIMFELSDHDDCDAQKEEAEIEELLTGSDDIEHLDDDDNDSIESEHSHDFSFPPLSEVSRNNDSDGLFTPPIGKNNTVNSPSPGTGHLSWIVEPTPVVTSPLVTQSKPPEVRKPMPLRPTVQSIPSVLSGSTSNDSSKVKKTAILPVSGSALDVVVILQRLVEFSQTISNSFVHQYWTGHEFSHSSTPFLGMKKQLIETNLEVHVLHLFI